MPTERRRSGCCATGARSKRYHHVLKGFNYRMDGIQGAILRVKLRHLEEWTEARRARARATTIAARGLRRRDRARRSSSRSAPRLSHLRRPHRRDRDDLQQELQADGVQTGLHYPIPVHLQQAHADLGYAAGDFPQSEAAAREVLSLPMYPEMTSTQVEHVSAVVHRHVYA